MVAEFPHALEVSGQYWKTRIAYSFPGRRRLSGGLNALADQDDIKSVTFNINGGQRALAERTRMKDTALGLLRRNR